MLFQTILQPLRLQELPMYHSTWTSLRWIPMPKNGELKFYQINSTIHLGVRGAANSSKAKHYAILCDIMRYVILILILQNLERSMKVQRRHTHRRFFQNNCQPFPNFAKCFCVSPVHQFRVLLYLTDYAPTPHQDGK